MSQLYHNTEQEYKIMKRDFGENEPSRVALSMIKPNSFVLSAGCGAGREVSFLTKQLDCEVIAVDIDHKAIELSKEENQGTVHFNENIKDFRFGMKFDYIVCLWNTINYLDAEDRKEFIRTCSYNLEVGGTLLIVTTSILTHWRHLPYNLKSRTNFHPLPSEITSWFKGTDFQVHQERIGAGILITAVKLPSFTHD